MRTFGVASLALVALCLTAGVASAQPDPDYVLNISDGSGPPMGSTQVANTIDVTGNPIAGWSWGVCQDDLVDVTLIEDGATTAMLMPAFVAPAILPGEGWTVGVVIDFFGMVFLQPGLGSELHLATYDILGDMGTSQLNYCDNLGAPPVETVLVDDGGVSITPVQNGGTIEIIVIPPTLITLRAGTAVNVPAGTSTDIAITLDSEDDDVEGFSFGLTHDGGLVTVTAVNQGQAVMDTNGGTGPSFFGPELNPVGGDGFTVGCVISLGPPPFDVIPAGLDLAIVDATYAVDIMAPMGTTPLDFTDTLGSPPVALTVVINDGTSADPAVESGSIGIDPPPTTTPFRRGDGNNDGDVDVADAVHIAEALFMVGTPLTCDDAGDTDDNGVLEPLMDTVYLLNFLFLSGAPVPAPDPFGPCGVDPTDMDGIGCDTYGGNCP